MERLFGRLNYHEIHAASQVAPHWNSRFMEEAKLDIRKQFKELGHAPLLFLGRTEVTAAPSGSDTACYYAKDWKPSADRTKEIMDELLEKIVPVIMASLRKPLEHSSISLNLADPKCGSSSGTVIDRIDISGASEHFNSSYEGFLKSTVEIDGVACATVESARLSEVESILKERCAASKMIAFRATAQTTF